MRIWPFALMTAAIVWACGPKTAIDLSGPAAKARPIASESQPETTSAIAPANFAAPAVERLVVVEMLNAGTFCLQVLHNVDQTLDPNLEAGAAEAGPCVKIE